MNWVRSAHASPLQGEDKTESWKSYQKISLSACSGLRYDFFKDCFKQMENLA